MADKNTEHRSGGVRVKAGVLPGVREIRRPDFTRKAADIEKAEAERVLKQGEVACMIRTFLSWIFPVHYNLPRGKIKCGGL